MARHLDLQTMEEETATTENKTDIGHCSVGASAGPNSCKNRNTRRDVLVTNHTRLGC